MFTNIDLELILLIANFVLLAHVWRMTKQISTHWKILRNLIRVLELMNKKKNNEYTK